MSYVPSHQQAKTLAQPNALTVIEHTASTTQTLTVGNRVQVGTVHTWYGSFSPTISTNQITLPIGYYYYVESMIQVYQTGSFSGLSYVSYQHYDETNSSNIGLPATVYEGDYEDDTTFSRDACARALIDATSAAVAISLKISAEVGNFDYINYSSGQNTSGLGRTVIWQLEDSP